LASISNQLRKEPVDLYDDAELIEQFKSGNDRAFNLLISRWNDAIYNFCLRVMGDRDDAAEITQRVFIKVYRKVESLQKPGAFKSWLYQIAMNQCRDEIKRRKRFQLFGGTSADYNESQAVMEDQPTFDIHDNPELQLDQLQLRSQIDRALLRIPEEQRLVVVMKELQQLTFPEIALVLETPEGTVKSRLYYGLRALNKIMTTHSHMDTL
jgi:RNA polymerase sigma-70 factor (ECF subfamily)